MTRPLLYNFDDYLCPDGIPELLNLLGLWTYWDGPNKRHRIYQREDGGRRPRLKWKVQVFKGGSVQEWQKFLSEITATEHLL